MGHRYAIGDGVAADPRKARELLAKAAAAGQTESADELRKLPP
jgi:TPR repeat protein